MNLGNLITIFGLFCIARGVYLLSTPKGSDPIEYMIIKKIWRYFKDEH